MQCLNLSNKEVRAAVDEVAKALGSEDAAYYIISENNGYAIDQAPNGEPSQLFSDLLEKHEGNREGAIIELAKQMSKKLAKIDKTLGVHPPQFEFRNIDDFLDKYSDGDAAGSISSGTLIQRVAQYLPQSSPVRRILESLSDTNVYVLIDDEGSITSYMDYNPSTDTIVINAQVFSRNTMGYNAESIAHEIIHAHTVRTLSRIKNGKATTKELNFYRSLEKLYEFYKEQFQSKIDSEGLHLKYYGFKNIEEFVAELLTNRYFVELLQENQPVKVKEGFLNSIKEFIKHLLSTLGLIQTDRDLTQIQQDLYDLVTYNITNDITEDYFADTDQDIYARESEAYDNVEQILKYTEQDKQKLDDILKNINQSILEGMQARRKVYNDPDPTVKAKVRAQMDWEIANISQGLATDLENIVNFLNDMQDEVKATSKFLIDSRKNNTLIDDTKLNDLDQNFFQFYTKTVDEIVKQLIHREPYREIVGKDKDGNYKLDRIIQRAKTYQSLLTEGQGIVETKLAENAANVLQQIGAEVGLSAVFSYNSLDSVTDSKDISLITFGLGAGDKIKDSCVKTIFYLLNKAEEKTNKDVFKVTQKFEELLKKVKKRDQLKLFEVDDDGNATGYLVRARNYGKFEQNYQKAMQDICMDLGIDITQMSLPENRTIRIQYNKRRNEWLSKHTERRFTKQYYDAFNHLSEEAASQRESIQLNIRTLTSKAKDEYGITRLERLSPAERDQLVEYEIQKRQLSSIYDYKGRKKQGIALQVAEELTELNKKLQEGFTMTKNSEAYEKEKARVLADKTMSKEQKDEWIRLNSKVQFKDEFYTKLKNLERKYYGPRYAELQERRRALLRMFRDDASGEVRVDLLPPATRNALSAISREMTRIRKAKKAETIEGENVFEEIADVVPTSQWYKDKIKYYDSVLQDNPEAAEQWLKDNSYTIKETLPNGKIKVKIQPKSWYTKMVPKDKSMIQTVPNNNWLEVSKESKFYNKAYYEAQEQNPELKGEYWIPKKIVKDDNGKVVANYDTSARRDQVYNNQPLKDLYDAILETLEEANSEYTNLNKTYPYRVPQVSGSPYRYMQAEWRRRRNLGRVAGLFKGFFEWVKDKISVRNDDVDFNQALTKPNGERLTLIPQNFIKRLDDPAVVSANLVGNVIEYYKSAKNWKHKTEIQPKVEILKNYVKGKKYRNGRTGVIKTEETYVYKFIKAFLDINLYGIKNQNVTVQYGGNQNGKLFGLIPYKGNLFNMIHYDISKPREINITKMLSILRALGTTRNLALNVSCAFTGGITALYSHLVNTCVQRYYNPVDAGYAFGEMITDMVINIPGKLGITTYKPFMSRCMEYFEVGAEASPDPTNRATIINMVTKHWGFGLYTLQDHFIKGQILGAVMHNFKLVIDADGNRRFVSREDYKRDNELDIYTPGDYLDWNFGDKPSFRDCVEFVAGELVAKDPANQKAVDEAIGKIGYTARMLAQSADGQLTNLQRSVWLSHSMGQFAMMHRQYLPVIIQERYTMERQYDYQTQRWKEGVLRTPYRLIRDAIQHNENIITAIRREVKQDPVARENLAKIIYEMILWQILAKIIRPLCSSSADEDKKNILKQILAYAIERSTFETLAPYNLVDMARVIKSPTAISSYIENLSEVTSIPFDILYQQTKSLITGQEYKSKRIRRGAYKGYTEWERGMWKLTPFKNLIELKDIQSKRNYYKKQILGE